MQKFQKDAKIQIPKKPLETLKTVKISNKFS